MFFPKESNRNVVYKIECKNCNATYVGQTGRKLKTRIQEHRRHINSASDTRSIITDHRLLFNHDFDWENVKILDRECYLGRKLISEMLHIQMQNNSLNLQSDTEFLHHAYIFNKLLIIYYFNA